MRIGFNRLDVFGQRNVGLVLDVFRHQLRDRFELKGGKLGGQLLLLIMAKLIREPQDRVLIDGSELRFNLGEGHVCSGWGKDISIGAQGQAGALGLFCQKARRIVGFCCAGVGFCCAPSAEAEP